MIVAKSKIGQSLLEVVFSIAILLMVVMAVLALTIGNISGQKESESQVIANNLAREAIEVIRNIRDSNWLAGRNWDEGLAAGSQAIVAFDRQANTWSLQFDTSNWDLYISPQGSYSHEVLADSQLTSFRRVVYFSDICLSAGGQEEIRDDCGGGQTKIGAKLTAEVSWNDRGKNRRIKIEDLLYAWK
ncbi:MAG: hypothetical protein RB292_00195 [Patescibacteria group bacterium]|jgi:type II secretory pathway pseudopilin PulG|nr:hypothetical protein [Patescibacteria group bacterium]